jgi:hypothetical protein
MAKSCLCEADVLRAYIVSGLQIETFVPNRFAKIEYFFVAEMFMFIAASRLQFGTCHSDIRPHVLQPETCFLLTLGLKSAVDEELIT